MDVMRNGNFEMGDDSYWTNTNFTSFNVTDVNPLYGTYSAVLVTSAELLQTLHNNDLIKVNSGDKVHVGGCISGVMDHYCTVGFKTYDRNGLELGSVYGSRSKGLGYYMELDEELIVPVWASYISFIVKVYNPGAAKTLYLDLCSLQVNSVVESYYKSIELMNEVNLAISGDSSEFRKILRGYGSYYAEIDCISLTGTAPTLDVEICELDQYGNERVLGQFTQIVGVTDQRVGIAKPIGMGIYVKYTKGGVWTDCDFKVSVIGVR